MRIEKGRDWETVGIRGEKSRAIRKRIRTEEAEKKQKPEEREFRSLEALSIRTLVFYAPWSGA